MSAPHSVMQNSEQPVQGVQRVGTQPSPDPLLGLGWDDVRIFSYLAEAGSFRAAAVKLKLSVNTVRAQVARIEDRVGESLLQRGFNGVKETLKKSALQRR